jgi:hypothetical protein
MHDFSSMHACMHNYSIIIRLSVHAWPTVLQSAAIYVIEGEKEDVCYHHPEGKWSRGAYFILHHRSYATLHLIVTFLFMLLVVPNTEAEHSLRLIKCLVQNYFNFSIFLPKYIPPLIYRLRFCFCSSSRCIRFWGLCGMEWKMEFIMLSLFKGEPL